MAARDLKYPATITTRMAVIDNKSIGVNQVARDSDAISWNPRRGRNSIAWARGKSKRRGGRWSSVMSVIGEFKEILSPFRMHTLNAKRLGLFPPCQSCLSELRSHYKFPLIFLSFFYTIKMSLPVYYTA